MVNIANITSTNRRVINTRKAKRATKQTPEVKEYNQKVSSQDIKDLQGRSQVTTYQPCVKINSRGQFILDAIRFSDPEKFELMTRAIKNTKYVGEISENTVADYIQELGNIKDTTTLKCALEANVNFKLVQSDDCATFTKNIFSNGRIEQYITLCENTSGGNNVGALTHELGHAFDYNYRTADIRTHMVPYLRKNPNGKYMYAGQRVDFFGYKPNAYSTIITSKKREEKGVISDNISMSEDFHKALLLDIKGLLEFDIKNGYKKGTTFTTLLADWHKDSYFGYYLGGEEYSTKVKMWVLKRELFAQMAALVTNGYTDKPDFDLVAPVAFPNIYNFVHKTIKSDN